MWSKVVVVAALLSWQDASRAVAPAQFDSSYTRLGEACSEEPGSTAGEGQDPLLRCAGPGGYWLHLSFSAADATLNVGKAAAPDSQLLEGSIPGIDTENGVVEWRLSDGQPVALIVRSTPLEFDDQGMLRTGQQQTLEIRGLGVLEGFSDSIDVRATAEANAEARARVETAYHQRIKH